jgi:segregation and condensation protein B
MAINLPEHSELTDAALREQSADDMHDTLPPTPLMEEGMDAAEPIPLKGQIEAALFVTNRPLCVAELAEQLRSDPLSVEEALLELMNDYAFRPDTALEIGDDTEGYILQVRQEFQPVAHAMMPMELPASVLRILSAIAIKGPILQSDLVETQGGAVYDAVPELLQRGLISKNRVGRSYRLNVTQKFNEYFKLLGDKQELRTMAGLLEGDVESGMAKSGKAIRLKDASSEGVDANAIGDDTQATLTPFDDDDSDE